MTQLQNLSEYNQILNDLKIALNNYHTYLRNDLFEIEPNENIDETYLRGEQIFDQRQENIRNISEIIDQEDTIIKFFEICKANKQTMINQNNKLIDKMIEIKKRFPNVTKEQIIECRESWNDKRIETEAERMNRETKEMLEIVTEKEKIIEEMTIKMNEKERELNELIEKAKVIEFKEEINGKINEVENNLNTLQNDHKQLNDNVTNISNKQNVIESNYVKKYEFNDLSIDYKTNISKEERVQLEEWTNKKCSEVLFDSDKDNWSQNTSVFGDKIINKSNLTFIVEDQEGNKFGGYITSTINKYNDWIKDSNAFIFSLKSNGRLNGMRKFNISNSSYAIAVDAKPNNYYLFKFGSGNDIRVERKNMTGSHCYQSSSFNYEGTENALRGTSANFIPKRITVIQMK